MKIFKKKYIAFLYEGIQSEETLFENICKLYFNESSEIKFFRFPADGNIYMLWKRLVNDEFETNVIDILKEMSLEARIRLEKDELKASDFSEIYLFFDYDGHAVNFSDNTLEAANVIYKKLGMPDIGNYRDILERMLQVFNNETEYGKLYISYPMVESIKEIDVTKEEYKRFYIKLDEIHGYKHSFNEASIYGNYAKLTHDMWSIACRASVKQAGLIVKYHGACTYIEFIKDITQLELYHSEKRHYINNQSGRYLAVLNSIPLFLLEYFDERFWNEVHCKAVEGA